MTYSVTRPLIFVKYTKLQPRPVQFPETVSLSDWPPKVAAMLRKRRKTLPPRWFSFGESDYHAVEAGNAGFEKRKD